MQRTLAKFPLDAELSNRTVLPVRLMSLSQRFSAFFFKKRCSKVKRTANVQSGCGYWAILLFLAKGQLGERMLVVPAHSTLGITQCTSSLTSLLILLLVCVHRCEAMASMGVGRSGARGLAFSAAASVKPRPGQLSAWLSAGVSHWNPSHSGLKLGKMWQASSEPYCGPLLALLQRRPLSSAARQMSSQSVSQVICPSLHIPQCFCDWVWCEDCGIRCARAEDPCDSSVAFPTPCPHTFAEIFAAF